MKLLKRYDIIDNGGTPYQATIARGGKGVDLTVIVPPGTASDREWDWSAVPMARRPADWARRIKFGPIRFRNLQRVFVGIDNSCVVHANISGPKCSPRHGNTLLLHARGSEYVLCGAAIYVFDIGDDDVIEEFYSPVGNSSVSYPYAIGQKRVYELSTIGNEIWCKSKKFVHCGSHKEPDMDEMRTGSRLPVLKLLRMRDEKPSKGLPMLYDFARMRPWSERERVAARIVAEMPAGVWLEYARSRGGDVAVSCVLLGGPKGSKVSFAAYVHDKSAMNRLSKKLWKRNAARTK